MIRIEEALNRTLPRIHTYMYVYVATAKPRLASEVLPSPVPAVPLVVLSRRLQRMIQIMAGCGGECRIYPFGSAGSLGPVAAAAEKRTLQRFPPISVPSHPGFPGVRRHRLVPSPDEVRRAPVS